MDKKRLKNLIDISKHHFNEKNFSYVKQILNKVVEMDPNCFEANEILAQVYESEANYLISCQFLEKAISNRKATIKTFYRLGTFQLILKDFQAAKNTFLKALEKFGESFEILHDLGAASASLGDNEQALSYFKKALLIKKDTPELFFNIGKIYDEAGSYHEAMAFYEKAIEIDPKFSIAYHNKAALLRDSHQYDKALLYFDEAIKVNPLDFDSICSKSTIYLLVGEFKKGWDAYEYRWKQMPPGCYRYPLINTLSNLNNLNNKEVLVWYEQGLGDTIQFSRYILDLNSLGANVTFEVQESLASLFQNNFNCKIQTSIQRYQYFDYQIPLLSLPKLFGTNINNIPHTEPYLKANFDDVDKWKRQLNLSNLKLNVAIAISGNPNHKNNQNRSIGIELFNQLGDIANIYILQKDLGSENIAHISTKDHFFFLGDLVNDFRDSAAIIEAMDLVISVDTSLIHLAGAMGKKAYLLLPYTPEWRWLLERSDSPWYNTVKIFRQPKKGEWSSVMNDVRSELNTLVSFKSKN